MPRTEADNNAINRVLKAWGLPSLEHPQVLAHFGGMVQDHTHFTELLKACEPTLRREMYDAMSPHLKFKPKSLEDYIIAAKDHAVAKQLPTMDEAGNLHPYQTPAVAIEIPQVELWVVCLKCDKEGFFYGEREADAIFVMRHSGWAFDESGHKNHLCPECLDAVD